MGQALAVLTVWDDRPMFAAATPSAKAKWQPAPDTDVFAEAESDGIVHVPRPAGAAGKPERQAELVHLLEIDDIARAHADLEGGKTTGSSIILPA